jgi:hypothetical protein
MAEEHRDTWRIAEAALKPYLASNVTIEPSAYELLDQDLAITLDRYLSLLATAARQRHMPVRDVVVYGYIDPEEDYEQIVISQWVVTNAERALTYWDQLGDVIDKWTRSLSEDVARDVEEHFAVEVRWIDEDENP